MGLKGRTAYEVKRDGRVLQAAGAASPREGEAELSVEEFLGSGCSVYQEKRLEN